MKKKIIYIILCILFLNIVRAGIDISYATGGTVACWDMDEDLDASGNFFEQTGQHNASNTNLIADTEVYKFGSQSWHGDGAGDYATDLGDESDFDFTSAYSVCAWVYLDINDGEGNGIVAKDATANGHGTWEFFETAGANDYIVAWGKADQADSNPLVVANATWTHVCTVFTSPNYAFYIDGNYDAGGSVVGDLIVDNNPVRLYMYYGTAAHTLNGNAQNIIISSKSWNSSEIAYIRNSGTGRDCAELTGIPDGPSPPASEPPSIDISLNITNFGNYSDNPFRVKVTADSMKNTTDLWNINVFISGIANATYNNIANLNITPFVFNMTNGLWETNLSVYVCANHPLNDSAEDCELKYFFLDSVNPTWSVAGIKDGKTYYKNWTSAVNGAETFYYNATVRDANLDTVNITFKNSTFGALKNHFKTDITTNNYTNHTEINLNEYPSGTYYINIQGWDDHNLLGGDKIHESANTITKDANNLRLDFKEGNINIYSPDTTAFKVTDENNKYTVEYSFKQLKDNKIYINDASQWRFKQTKHKGHLVNIYLNKYFDLDSEALTVKSVEKIGDQWVITVDAGATIIKTNSIGDLNYIDVFYTIYLKDSFYIYAVDDATNISINDFSITLYNATNQYYLNTTTGVVIFNLTQGNYSLNFSASGFINQQESNISASAGGNYTLRLNATNAFRVYIKDQLTHALIQPQVVYLEFIDANFNNSNNYSTSLGFKYITDLTPSDYIIRYSSAGYSTDFYYFTLVNGTNTQFTIYMLANTSTDEVTATVVDEILNPVPDAYIHVQRYDINTNTYPTVSIVKTNFEGVAILRVTKNTEFYRFLIYYNDVLKLSVAPTYIYEDEINFQISLGEAVAENFFITQGVTHSLDYNEATENFRFIYADASNAITSGILRVYNISTFAETLVNQTELSATSGTILITASNRSGVTYRADTYVNIGGEEYYLGSGFYSYPEGPPLTEKKNIVFYLVMLTILFAGVSFWDIRVGVILAPLPWLFASALNWIPIQFYYTMILEVLAIIAVGIMTYSGAQK